MLKKILHIVEYINSLKQHKFLIGVSTYKKMHMWTTWVMDITSSFRTLDIDHNPGYKS